MYIFLLQNQQISINKTAHDCNFYFSVIQLHPCYKNKEGIALDGLNTA